MKKTIVLALFLASFHTHAQWVAVKNFDFIPGTATSGFNSERFHDMYQVNDSTVLCSMTRTICCSSGYTEEILHRTTDYGATWAVADYYSMGFLDVPWYFDGLSTPDSIIRTNLSNLELSADGGINWDTLSIGPFTLLHEIFYNTFDFYDLNHALFWSFSSQELYLFLNGTTIVLPYTDSIPAHIKMISPSKAFMICDGGDKLLVTNDAGYTWSTALDIAPTFRYLEFPTPLTGYLSCNGGIVYKTIDGGLNWNALSAPGSNDLVSSSFVNDSLGFFAGDNGTIIRTTDGGITWSDQSMSWAGDISKISVSDHVAYCTADYTFVYRNQNLTVIHETLQKEARFSIYPNPTNDHFILSNPDGSRIRSIKVFNATGQCEFMQEVNTLSSQVQINIATLSTGIKTVLIEGEKNYAYKLMVE